MTDRQESDGEPSRESRSYLAISIANMTSLLLKENMVRLHRAFNTTADTLIWKHKLPIYLVHQYRLKLTPCLPYISILKR